MRQKDSRLNGLNPLSYVGANAYSPPNLTIDNRAPTANDSSNFNIGSIWVDESTTPEEVYILTALYSGSATWQPITLGTSIPIVVSEGGTGRITLNDHSVLVGAGTNPITQLTVGSSGQILVGSVGADPVFANVGSGTGIDVTEGAGTISLDVASIIAKTITTDAGSAVAAANVLTITGGNNANTVGAGSTVTVHATTAVDVATSYVTDAGTAVPAANVINVLGGTDANTSAAGSTITINSTATPTITLPSSICSFLAYQDADGGDAAVALGISLGEEVIMTEVYDIGSNFTVGDGAGVAAVFTAPQDGKYLLQAQITLVFGSTTVIHQVKIITSNRTYKVDRVDITTGSTISTEYITVVADMDSGDTATYWVRGNVGVSGTVRGNFSSDGYQTYVSGSLI